MNKLLHTCLSSQGGSNNPSGVVESVVPGVYGHWVSMLASITRSPVGDRTTHPTLIVAKNGSNVTAHKLSSHLQVVD